MQNARSCLTGFVCALILAVLCVRPGYAHDGGPRLQLDTQAAAPGSGLRLTGANLGTDLVVLLQLVGEGRVVPLGTTRCSGHGDFIRSVILPADLGPGLYQVQVLDTSVEGVVTVLASAALRIDPEAEDQASAQFMFVEEAGGPSASPARIVAAAGLMLGLATLLFGLVRPRWDRSRNTHQLSEDDR